MRIVAVNTYGAVLLTDLERRRLEFLHPGLSGEFVTRRPTSPNLKIVFDKEAAIVVCFKPVVQMNLIQIRSDDFLAQFMGCADAQDLRPCRPRAISETPPGVGLRSAS